MSDKALFVPLYAEFFDAFVRGEKTVEHRTYGPRWNERTCWIGRRVTLSRGYGKQHRLTGCIMAFRHTGATAQIFIAIDRERAS